MYTRVLLVGNDPSVKGGITSVITQILSHDWESENIDMTFIPTYIETNTVNKVLYYIKAYVKIRRFLKNKKIDVVHIHMSYRGSFYRKYLIHKLCRKYQVRDIVHLHGSEFKKWYDESNNQNKRKIKQLLKESSYFIVLGEKWKEIIEIIEPQTNIKIIKNTIKIPERITGWNEPFKVLFLGVLIKRKGVGDLLEAIKLLKNKNLSVRYIIAGSGEEENYLKEKAVNLKIDNQVEFIGWIDGEKKKELLESSQLLVLPSYNEGLPIAILEAMSYGLPIIANDVGDISSAVRDDINGYLCQPGDIYGLANSLYKIISDKNLYLEMVRNSRKIAEKEFNEQSYFKLLKKCYETGE